MTGLRDVGRSAVMTGRTGGDRWVGIRSRVSVMVTMSSGMRTCHQRREERGCLLTVAARLVCPRWCPFSTVAGVILGPGLRRCVEGGVARREACGEAF